MTLNYTYDEGAKSFFNFVMNKNTNQELGGSVQWVNGTLE